MGSWVWRVGLGKQSWVCVLRLRLGELEFGVLVCFFFLIDFTIGIASAGFSARDVFFFSSQFIAFELHRHGVHANLSRRRFFPLNLHCLTTTDDGICLRPGMLVDTLKSKKKAENRLYLLWRRTVLARTKR